MNTYLDCVPCFLRQTLEAARGATDDVRIHEQIVRDVLRMTAELDLDQSPPFVGQAIHRRLRELTGVMDPYEAAKRRFNRLAVEALPELADIVRQAEDPLLAAAKCAVAANAIDMGVASAITDAEVRSALRGLPVEVFDGRWARFLEAVTESKDILYLADNAGEIAVDRLVIETLGAERVTVAVRRAPVLNDATMADAHQVGMHELVPVIDNGSDAPGTILDDCSTSFRRRFDRADLIIAKGQGNFETLSGAGNNIAFWFKVKCPLVARQVGLPVGTHALLPPAAWCSAPAVALQGGHP
jgi:damage-control phosphatase, subfamily I